ncbi:GFA family protein [Ruegeria sp. R13_0]|uniref:GFA family protein n=1 Tax=Ruegeria sp. R13_0 TaxID=2821099 RepID=UPI001ADA107F|nr:GFA family protein [Ruegeria sp. R13_0]MBO9436851.1 GFA family protein [Ruegeria sp. R13_0]
MIEVLEGECLCGAVKYCVNAAPIVSGACYCRDCQKTSGGAEAHGMMFPASAVTVVQGTPTTFARKVESGNDVFRQFCPVCGVHVMSWNSTAPEYKAIKVGTLKDPSVYQSQGSLWVSSAQSWHRPDPMLPQHSKMPCVTELSTTP